MNKIQNINFRKLVKRKRYKQFSVTQRCNINKFKPTFNGPKFDICGNCKWARETYPCSDIINCTKQCY